MREFKLDTGAEVSVCGVDSYSGELDKLYKPDKKLVGPGSITLNVLGFVNATLRVGSKSIVEKIYVVKNQVTNLLSKNACMSLGLITCDVNHVYNVTSDSDVSDYCDFQSEYPDIFIGLGRPVVHIRYRYVTMLNPSHYTFRTKCHCPVYRP